MRDRRANKNSFLYCLLGLIYDYVHLTARAHLLALNTRYQCLRERGNRKTRIIQSIETEYEELYNIYKCTRTRTTQN